MDKAEAMAARCDCGKQIIGGWMWIKGQGGSPNYSRISWLRPEYGPSCGFEVHSQGICFSPRRLPSRSRVDA